VLVLKVVVVGNRMRLDVPAMVIGVDILIVIGGGRGASESESESSSKFWVVSV